MARWSEADLKRKTALKKPTPTLAPSPPAEAHTPQETPQIEPLPVLSTAPIRWEQATGLHAQQFGTRFRLVVVGPLDRLPEVTALLDQLRITDLPA